MLASHNKKFIFLKTRKTAGTSVEFALQRFCVPPGVAPNHRTAAIETRYGIVGRRGPAQNDMGLAWYNHMPAAELKIKLSDEVWNSYRRICTIRNPWDQVVSAFHFYLKSDSSYTRRSNIYNFKNWLLTSMKSKMSTDSNIYSIEGMPVIDTYIRHSNIEEDFDKACNEIGVERVGLQRLKSEFRDPAIPYVEYYDNQSVEFVAEVFAKPIEWFGWRFEAAAPDRLPCPADRPPPGA
ncbi:MAG: hypothetical protein LAT81_15380 [Oceanicaulis sp.]|nr:hypothetical protein [Oceanicaulis sp.]